MTGNEQVQAVMKGLLWTGIAAIVIPVAVVIVALPWDFGRFPPWRLAGTSYIDLVGESWITNALIPVVGGMLILTLRAAAMWTVGTLTATSHFANSTEPDSLPEDENRP